MVYHQITTYSKFVRWRCVRIPLDGEKLRWAREDQNLTLRAVHAQGGPTPSYLSDLEKSRKDHPKPEVLTTLCSILNISEAFALGQISKYRDDPIRCRGLASDVSSRIRDDRSLRSMGALERSRKVLRIICGESTQVRKVDIAYILDVTVTSLDDLLAETFPINQAQMKILADLTGLPEVYFRKGLDEESYKPVIDLAMELGLTPDETIQLIKQASGQPARHHVDGEGEQAPGAGKQL